MATNSLKPISLTCMMAFFLALQVSATTWYVKPTGDDTAAGTTWATAFLTVQKALTVANSGDRIWVAAGIYKPTATADRNISFVMIDSVAILGGFPGTGDPGIGDRDWVANLTILSGDLGAAGNIADNSYTVVVGTNADSTAVLDGFTVTDGNASGPAGLAVNLQGYGGGMFINGGGPTINNCSFEGNTASDQGGGVFSNSSSPVFAHCTFANNFAGGRGGGFNCREGGIPVFTSCNFQSNQAILGAGMFVGPNASVQMTDCSLRENHYSAHASGVGMYIYLSPATTITNTLFLNNTSPHSSSTAGAVLIDQSSPAFTNCTMRGNFAANGGAIANTGAGTNPTLINCIIYDNPTVNGEPIFNTNSATSTLSYTLLDQATCPVGSTCGAGMQLGQDPQFISESNLHIQTCSPVIDAGLDSANPTLVDADGNSRKVDAIAGGSMIDLGAYERQAPLTADRLYVNANLSESKEGTSWGDAFNNLQEAMTYSCPGVTEIWVAAGTYKSTTTTDRNISFMLKNGVTIYGGFPDTGNPGISDRDWVANLTILSGDLGVAGNVADNSYTVVVGTNADSTAVLDGFTVTDGNADGTAGVNNPEAYGGGMYIDGGGPTINNCVVEGNAAIASGGGLFSISSSPVFSSCTIENNIAGSWGGGFNGREGGIPVFTSCNFQSNQAVLGAGMFVGPNASVQMTDCSVRENYTNVHSAGIGMYIYLSPSTVITNTLFLDNVSSFPTSTSGAAVIDQSSPVFTNCTITGNSGATGGAMSILEAGTNPTLINCIIYDNPTVNGEPILNKNSATSTLSYTLLEQATCPTGSTCGAGMLLGQDPQFVSKSNLHLLSCSPVIDAGLDSANPTLVDADSNIRKVDAIAGGSMIDLGAYERQAPLTADRLYVNANLTESKEGTSWGDAFNNLQEAMTYNCPGVTEIWVAAGIYKPTNDTNRNISFVMKDSVKILGGFPDTGNPGIGDRDWVGNSTILSGDLQGNDGQQPIATDANTNTNTEDNSYTIVNGSGNGSSAILDGFIITAGNAYGNDTFPSPTSRGAGMMIDGGAATVMNCNFSGNAAPNNGGAGMYVTNGAIVPITNCNFTGNVASSGAGIFFEVSTNSTLTNCSFTSNIASNSGGGIRGNTQNLTLTDCSFTSNSATNGGGVLISEDSTCTLTNCSFINNSASYAGGGIFINNANLTLTDCSFSGNSAKFGGGYWQQITSTSSLTNCTFTNNNAASSGGVFYNFSDCNANFSNCTFTSNSAASGGGGIINYGSITSYACTFTSNIAALGGGGIMNFGSITSSACTFTGNSAAFGGGIANVGASTTSACTFNDNNALNLGAGIYGESTNSNSIVSNCTFTTNQALTGGGICLNAQSMAQVTDCSFTDNIISTGNGGGISITNSSQSTISNCIFTNNSGPNGGGIGVSASTSTISNCIFDNNVASNWGGGVLTFANSFSTISDCTFSSNQALFGGGLNIYENTSANVTGCTFRENFTNGAGSGAGMYIFSSPATTVTNTAFIDNTVSHPTGVAGAVVIQSSTPTFINCTMSGNSAAFGGAITNSGAGTNPSFINCIVYNNPTTSGESFLNDNGAMSTLSYSLVEQDTCPTGTTCDSTVIFNQDPLFVNTDSFDLRLLPCSPAIDVGDNASNISTQDINGNPRIFNASGLVDSIIDMGAYEMPTDNTLPTIWTGLGDGVLWSDAKNWDDGFIPQPCRDIIIPSMTVTVPAGYEAQGKTLDVLIGAEIITEPTGVMDIKEN